MATAKLYSRSIGRRIVSLGRHVIRFKIANCTRHFTVHEDPICAYSDFFKQKLQKNRKPLEPGQCSICHKHINPTCKDITFCQGECGQNFCQDCIDEWIRSQSQPVKCPLCQCDWKNRDEQLISIDSPLDPDAVRLYVDWLYLGKLQLFLRFCDAVTHEGMGQIPHLNTPIFLLKAWTVAHIMEDSAFEDVISKRYIRYTSRKGIQVDVASILYAFQEQNIVSMRSIVLEQVLANFTMDWYMLHLGDFPDGFAETLMDELNRMMMAEYRVETARKEIESDDESEDSDLEDDHPEDADDELLLATDYDDEENDPMWDGE